jgi:hypothetical protein
MATNNTYTNIKDILKQFEIQVVQAKHYKKNEVYTQTQTNTAITNAIAGVNQFNIVKASSASNTPKGVTWTSGSTTITGTLEASAADKHTIYYVPSTNGTNDSYDEYMALATGSDTSVWEKLGNSDVNLSGYVPTSRKINNHALTSNITISKSDVGLGNVTNTATESTITQASGKNITSGAVYDALNASITESTSHGITLGGTVNAPTITVDTTGSISAGGSGVVVAAQVYSFVTDYAQQKNTDLTAIAALEGTKGFLKKTNTNTWTLDNSVYLTTTTAAEDYLTKNDASGIYLSKTAATDIYLTQTDAASVYAGKSEAVCFIDFDTTHGLRFVTADHADSPIGYETTIASISTLKSGLGINDKASKTTTISSSNSGVALGGTINSPTVTVTGGSVVSGNGSVVKGGTVYDYISSSSGVLYMSDTDFSDILANV